MVKFKKLMREQVQKSLDKASIALQKPTPKKGWINTIKTALGISSKVLAKKLGCAQSNIIAMEKREIQGTITLNALKRAAEAMDCTLGYCLIPKKPISSILEEQARTVAKRQISFINQSMSLEQQGLTAKQLQQQEDDLVKELLEGNLKNIWNEDEF